MFQTPVSTLSGFSYEISQPMKEHSNDDFLAQNHQILTKSSFELLSHELGNQMRQEYS